jgi:hypothetical protein
MKIKKANLKRLASLSALGAGALGVATGAAEASSIVYSGVLDKKVAYLPGGTVAQATIAGPHGAGGVLSLFDDGCCTETLFNDYVGVNLAAKPGAHGTDFRFLATASRFNAAGAPLNAEWGTAFRGFSADRAQAAIWAYSLGHSGSFTAFNSTDRYLLFRFTGGSLPSDLYGWAQLTVSFTNPTFDGPIVTLVDYAYDTSGAEIPAGDTGTPEPSTFALSGLAALVLGAKGLRSWRAARKAEKA